MTNQSEKNALKDVAEFMCLAARTAPRTRGIDNIETVIVPKAKLPALRARMKKIAKRDNRPSCARDAENIKGIDTIMVIGTRTATLGLDCGFCGFKNCKALQKAKGVCAYNSMDLGIALGSAASLAARFHADNRLMYSIGKAALEIGLFKTPIKIAIGIPLSATGKNIFFDRK